MTPSNPVQTPSTDVLPNPVHPIYIGRGRGWGFEHNSSAGRGIA